MKIYNCNRSPNATVGFQIYLSIAVFEGVKLQKFKEVLQQHVKTQPRKWDSVNYVRCDLIDADNEKALFTLSFRHCNSWQDVPRIMIHRSDLIQFVQATAAKLKIIFWPPPPRRVLYYGGVLEEGAVEAETRRAAMLRKSNIRRPSTINVFDESPEAIERKKSV